MKKKTSVKMLFPPDIGEIKGPDVAGTERMLLKDKDLLEEIFDAKAYARFSYPGVNKIFFSRFLLPVIKSFERKTGRVPTAIAETLLFLSDLLYVVSFFVSTPPTDLILSYCFPLIALVFPSRTIVFLHFFPAFHFNRLLKHRYEKVKFVFCSEFFKKQIEAAYPHIKFDATVIYNSTDTDTFRPLPKIRSQYPKQKIRLLYASAWVPQKGLVTLLTALRSLPDRISNSFELTISSSPNLWFQEFPDNNSRYIKKIFMLAKKSKNVQLLHGVEYKDMPQLYNAHDFVVFPSNWPEPFGLVVLEALACGTPIISSVRGALPEIISPSNTVVLKKVTVPEIQRVLLQVYYDKKKKSLVKRKRSLFTRKNISMEDSTRSKILKNFLLNRVSSLPKDISEPAEN